ncbi:hypothetical protein B0H14DRAFT_2597869 [Mycena olivaceomarginata]|nr:hypothetical protein B0H14DRAFT_2597869 [Mycena olivaceomarginata]
MNVLEREEGYAVSTLFFKEIGYKGTAGWGWPVVRQAALRLNFLRQLDGDKRHRYLPRPSVRANPSPKRFRGQSFSHSQPLVLRKTADMPCPMGTERREECAIVKRSNVPSQSGRHTGALLDAHVHRCWGRNFKRWGGGNQLVGRLLPRQNGRTAEGDHCNGGLLEWVANLEPPRNFAFKVVLGEVLNQQLELLRRMRKIDGTSRAEPHALIIGIEDDVYGS